MSSIHTIQAMATIITIAMKTPVGDRDRERIASGAASTCDAALRDGEGAGELPSPDSSVNRSDSEPLGA